MEPLTRDSFFNGNIVLNQPRSGYRFSIDAIILAHLAEPPAEGTVLDLGTGCGVVSIIMAYRNPGLRVIGVEIQPSLAAVAQENVAANGMSERVRILEKDMNRLALADIGGPVDLVVSNPPYRPLNAGRISPHSQKAIARHEIKVDLKTVIATARSVLNLAGRFCVIYPAVRTVDLLAAMRAGGLEPKRLTMIHSSPASPARLVAVTGIKAGGPELAVRRTLYL
jgi:tRNA1Val (adenine37-N6)-methyltransferase